MAVVPNLYVPNQYLSNFSVRQARDNTQFRAAASIPSINVQNQSGIYRVFDSEALQKVRVRPVASGTQTAAGEFGYGEGTYHAQIYGLHVDLDPISYHNAAQSGIQLERDSTDYLTTQMLIERELRFYQTFMSAGVWGEDMAGGTDFVQFDDAASDPITIIQNAALRAQLRSGGFMPNTLFVGRRVFNALLNHPDVIDRLRYTGTAASPAIANEQTLAALFGLSNIVVFDTIVGDESGDPTALGDNTMLLVYVNGSAGPNSVTAMARFNWVGPNNYWSLGGSIIRMDHPLLDGTVRLEIKYSDSMQVVAPTLGVFFSDVLSTDGAPA